MLGAMDSRRGGLEMSITARMAALAVAGLLVAATPAAASTLRIESVSDPGSLDPALNFQFDGGQLLYAACLKLVNTADAAGAAGSVIVPDAATALPTVSPDGLTYTFTVREGLRFSPPSGELVDAQTFKHAIERVLAPQLASPGAQFYADIVGAQDVIDGNSSTASGIVADGQTLTVTLLAPRPDFLDRMALNFACAVPHDTPVVAGGVGAPLASAGPYYVASYTQGVGGALMRNPSYDGTRPHGFDEIDFRSDLDPATIEADVLAGRADYTREGFPTDDVQHLYDQYGPGSPHQQFFVNPHLGLDFLVLNASRPLFSTVRARRAVNLAIDREAMVTATGAFSGTPTDQLLPPGLTAFRDAHVYPLHHPDFRDARRVLGATTGTASIYTCDLPFCLSWARTVRRDLAKIGLGGEIHAFPLDELFARLFTPGEPFDIAPVGFDADYADGADVLGVLVGAGNLSRWDDPTFDARLAAAALLSGPARDAAYGQIDVDLMRHAAPVVPLFNPNTRELTSSLVSNVLFTPLYATDLAALQPAD
jgi:ABC-type transport system substrate-binding protein